MILTQLNIKKNFITFEGVEGSGKSTQTKKLFEFLQKSGQKCILTREPGGCEASNQIREILIHNSDLSAQTELLLNFASRIEHINQLIRPAISQGYTIISDRYIDSTYAYQGYGFGLGTDIIDSVCSILSAQLLEPSITFLIDISIETLQKRVKNRSTNNKYEKFDIDFHEKVRNGYLEIAKNNNRICVINGELAEEDVFSQILAKLK